MELPKLFTERYSSIVDDSDAFLASLTQRLPKSFRINPLKGNKDEIIGRMEAYGIRTEQTEWCKDAFISDTPELGSTLEHFLGSIYLQELVSMLPPVIISSELQQARTVLDACAAPGSKTTQMAAIMENKGTIIANDLSYSRIRALRFNLEKTGVLNTVITNYDLRRFPHAQFDAVVLDAPCSAEGTIRKNYKVFSTWSEKNILGIARMQKQLILRAFDLLVPGGVLVYSTCTFAPEENEAVVDHLLQEREATMEEVDVPGMKLSNGIQEWHGKAFSKEVAKTVRIWPHHNNTGGFFVARVRK